MGKIERRQKTPHAKIFKKTGRVRDATGWRRFPDRRSIVCVRCLCWPLSVEKKNSSSRKNIMPLDQQEQSKTKPHSLTLWIISVGEEEEDQVTSPPPSPKCVCAHTHTHIHTERFIYLRFFVSFLSESSFFYRKLPFWLFLVDRGTWQYVGRPRSDELWRRQHPQCPSPLASSSITHSAHSPPTGTRQKKKQQKKTMSVSFASSDNRPFFFKTHLVAFCLSGILIQIQFSFSFEKKKKNEKRKLIHELDEILIGLAYRGQRTQSSLLDQNPVLGSKANSRAVTHFLYSLFFFFFYVSERKTFFSPFKIVTIPFFIYRLPFIDWQQYVTKNIN